MTPDAPRSLLAASLAFPVSARNVRRLSDIDCRPRAMPSRKHTGYQMFGTTRRARDLWLHPVGIARGDPRFSQRRFFSRLQNPLICVSDTDASGGVNSIYRNFSV